MRIITVVMFALLFSQLSFAGDNVLGRGYSTKLASNSDRVTFYIGYPGLQQGNHTECIFVTPVFSNGSIPTEDQFNIPAFAGNFAVLDRSQSIKPVLSKGTLIYRLRSLGIYLATVSFVTDHPRESFNNLIRTMNLSQQEIKILLKLGDCPNK